MCFGVFLAFLTPTPPLAEPLRQHSQYVSSEEWAQSNTP